MGIMVKKMETTILGLYIYIYPISLFLGTLNIRCRIYNRDPKGGYNFDNNPHKI